MDILKDLTDAEVATLARTQTPKPMAGVWVLTAPDGQTWTGNSPIQCVQAEVHSRVPPQVALARIRQSMWDQFPTGGEPSDYTARGYDPLGAVALRVEGGGLTQCDMHDDESY